MKVGLACGSEADLPPARLCLRLQIPAEVAHSVAARAPAAPAAPAPPGLLQQKPSPGRALSEEDPRADLFSQREVKLRAFGFPSFASDGAAGVVRVDTTQASQCGARAARRPVGQTHP